MNSRNIKELSFYEFYRFSWLNSNVYFKATNWKPSETLLTQSSQPARSSRPMFGRIHDIPEKSQSSAPEEKKEWGAHFPRKKKPWIFWHQGGKYFWKFTINFQKNANFYVLTHTPVYTPASTNPQTSGGSFGGRVRGWRSWSTCREPRLICHHVTEADPHAVRLWVYNMALCVWFYQMAEVTWPKLNILILPFKVEALLS